MKKINRSWVKTAALIFVTALLILTFFSNTILNLSLPEVSGQSGYGGEISTAVRGTGTVVANESFVVQLDSSRQIKRVLVHVGDQIEAGQTLFELEPKESGELEAAQDALDAAKAALVELEYNYQKSLLSLPIVDNRKDQMDLQQLQDALTDAIAQLEKSNNAVITLASMQANADFAAERLKNANAEIAALEEQISEIVLEIDPDLLTGDMKRLKDELDAATRAKKDADTQLAYAKEQLAQAQASVPDTPATPPPNPNDTLVDDLKETMDDALIVANAALAAAKVEIDRAYSAVYDADMASGAPTGNGYPAEYANYRSASGTANINQALQALLSANISHEIDYGAPASVDTARTAWLTANNAYLTAKAEYDAAVALTGSTGTGTGSTGEDSNVAYWKDQVRFAQSNVDSAEYTLEMAQRRFDEATKDIEVSGKKEKIALEDTKKRRQKDIPALEQAVELADRELEKAKEDAALTPEKAQEAVRAAESALELKIIDLDIANLTQERTDQINDLDFEHARRKISEQAQLVSEAAEKVQELRDKEGAAQVTARYGGTVLSIGVEAGSEVTPETTLATIEVNGKGYTLSFSVTNEETHLVNIGDIATISSWGLSDVVCTLVAIRSDRDDPTRRKLLEFSVEGDVTAGQNLDLSVGTRSQYFDMVVPLSAVFEDADGKFVLVAIGKQAPLGTRYIATRVDVEVLASDTKNAAISGEFDWSPYIITRSTKPIEPNTQVRLVG